MRFLEGEVIGEIDKFFVDSAKFLDLKLPANHQHIQIDYGEIIYKDFGIETSFNNNSIVLKMYKIYANRNHSSVIT